MGSQIHSGALDLRPKHLHDVASRLSRACNPRVIQYQVCLDLITYHSRGELIADSMLLDVREGSLARSAVLTSVTDFISNPNTVRSSSYVKFASYVRSY